MYEEVKAFFERPGTQAPDGEVNNQSNATRIQFASELDRIKNSNGKPPLSQKGKLVRDSQESALAMNEIDKPVLQSSEMPGGASCLDEF